MIFSNAFAQWTEPTLLPPPINVNPSGQYYYSTISADGRVLCMTILHGSPYDDDVYISELLENGDWTVPVNAGPNVNTDQRNLSPSITNDRQRLYYVSYTGSYDVMVSERTGPGWDDWSPGVPLPVPINRGREFTAQILWDDSTLCFTSTGQPGPHTTQDAMYTSRLQPDGSWSEPELIASHLNRLNGSLHPCLTDSGNVVVYGMFGGPNIHFDIFYAVRCDTGFGPAISCDSTINSPFWDSGPSCPANGSLLYFESRRPIDGDTNWAARLYVARRIPSEVPGRNESGSPRLGFRVYPSFGSGGSLFEILVPSALQGRPIYVVNVLGQQVDVLHPENAYQTTYYWKGANHEMHSLPSGPYFLYTFSGRHEAAARITIVK